jgi:hypothetical protein
MATQKAVTGNSQKLQDTGFILMGGTIGSSRHVAGNKAYTGAKQGPDTTPKDAVAGVDEAVSAGTFANIGSVIAKVDTTIAGGVANTFFRKMGDATTVRTFHKIEQMSNRNVALAIRAGQWSIFSGAFMNAPSISTWTGGADYGAVASGGVYTSYGDVEYLLGGRPTATGVKRVSLAGKTQ